MRIGEDSFLASLLRARFARAGAAIVAVAILLPLMLCLSGKSDPSPAQPRERELSELEGIASLPGAPPGPWGEPYTEDQLEFLRLHSAGSVNRGGFGITPAGREVVEKAIREGQDVEFAQDGGVMRAYAVPAGSVRDADGRLRDSAGNLLPDNGLPQESDEPAP